MLNDNQNTQSLDKDTTAIPLQSAPDSVFKLRSVTDIQKAYSDIIKQKESGSLDSTSFKYNCGNEKSGTVSYFSNKTELKIIIHRYSEYDHYNAEDYYYIQEGKVIFSHRKSITWAFEDGPEGATKDNITEQRIYLINEKPLKCLEKKYVIHSKSANNPRSENVQNKEVDCGSLKSVIKPFEMLTKYQLKAPSRCLEE